MKRITIASVICYAFLLGACHSDTGNPANNPSIGDTNSKVRKVSIVISSIPFPSSILDTLHNMNGKFQSDLPNSPNSTSLYSESNSQAANLGVYGADLAYVISFEQFQSVGLYMKATKVMADNIGIPLAFTQEVLERCQKNQNNKDSLSCIEFQSYNVIDQTLKQNKRDASEVLVLTGGWIEGVYLTTQTLGTVPQGEDKHKIYHVLLEQKQYVDKLLILLNDVGASSNYCKDLIAPMQDVKTAFDAISSEDSFNDENLQKLADKVKDIRTHIVKGNS